MKKRPRIKYYVFNEEIHDKKVITILSKIYEISFNEVKKLYYKMERKIKDTKIAISIYRQRLAVE